MRASRGYAAAAGLIVALGAVARAAALQGRGSFWLDELFTAHTVAQPWRHMLSLIADDTHPPGYYILLKLWLRLLGDSDELALRSFSAAVAVMGLVAVAALGPRVVGRGTAILWLVALAGSPILVTYSAEARMYSLLSALACLLALAAAAVYLEANGRRAWIATLLAVSAAMSAVHLFGALVATITGFTFGCAAIVRHRSFATVAPWFWSAGAAIVSYSAWLALTWTHVSDASRAVAWIPTPDRTALALTVVELAGGSALLLALATASFVSIAVRLNDAPGVQPSRGELATLSLSVVAVTLLVTWIVSQWFSLWQTRYFIGLVPLLSLAAAIPMADLAGRAPNESRRHGVLIALAAGLAAVAVLFGQLTYVVEDWRGAAARLLSLDAPAGVPILVREMERNAWLVYTDTLAGRLSPGHPPIPAGRLTGVTGPESLSAATTGQHRVLWLQAHLPRPTWVDSTFAAEGFACTAEEFTGNGALLDCRR